MSGTLGSSPARLPAADLAAAFGPPDRAAGLAGKLAPTPRPAAPPQVSPGEPAAPAVSDAWATATSAPPPSAEPLQRAAPDSASPEDAVQPVIVYLAASLRERVRDRVALTRSTYTELVLAAIDATHAQLGALLANGQPRARDRSLFTGSARPRRQRHDEPQVQVSLRPARRDLDVIDRLVVELQAPSRSALIATALAAYLDQPAGV